MGSGNITIRADDPFLPPEVAALMPAGSSITLARRYEELGLAENQITDANYQFNFGLTGKFGGSWSWDVRAVYGENVAKQDFPNQPLTGRSALSADAVTVTSANVGASGLPIGSVACRSTLTSPGNGCVPMNPFGAGNISSGAFDYMLADAWNKRWMGQQQYMADLRGEPFSLWAGPVSLAVGGEYRRETAIVKSDPISQVNGFAVGGVSQPAMNAAYNVDEAYVETIIPLAKDWTLAKEFDVTLAGRHTDYSTSGGVNTWKVGVNYRPFDDLRLRLTRSRDIRAPNLGELFSPATPASSPGFIVDPRTGVAPLAPTGSTISYLTSGNPSLKPEIAQTLTYGGVYQPHFIPGLPLSVDYTHIKVDGAIGQVAIQTILNQCFINNNPSACPLIVTGPGNTLVSVNSSYLNLSSLDFSSIDWEGAVPFRPGGSDPRRGRPGRAGADGLLQPAHDLQRRHLQAGGPCGRGGRRRRFRARPAAGPDDRLGHLHPRPPDGRGGGEVHRRGPALEPRLRQ
ncbi:MAG: TonB-dependent receptor [Caulobacteraceae bacterium]